MKYTGDHVGLLEKAGQIQTDGAKPAPKKKAAKAAKPKKAKKKEVVSIEDELDDLDLGGSDGGSRALPDEFVLAGKPARFARALIDFLASYGWLMPILAIEGMGTFWNPTYFYIAGLLIFVFNLIVLPIMTNRTIGNFVSITKFVTHHGSPPFFLHLTLRGLNFGFFAGGLIALLIGFPTMDSVVLGIGFGLLAICFADYVVKKVRHEKQQGLYDSMFNAYLVSHVRSGDEEGWLGRLESLADFGESRFKLGGGGDDDEESEDGS